MVFQHSGGRDFDLPRHFHYSGVIPMVFQHSGRVYAAGLVRYPIGWGLINMKNSRPLPLGSSYSTLDYTIAPPLQLPICTVDGRSAGRQACAESRDTDFMAFGRQDDRFGETHCSREALARDRCNGLYAPRHRLLETSK